jgi:hypothetical protein
LTLVRSGGYTENNGLEDALFVFGRTFEEVKLMPKCRIPTGLVNLLRRNKMQNIALETGFFYRNFIKEKTTKRLVQIRAYYFCKT